MDATDDETAHLIRDLDDPAKFVRRACVAVFMPHEITFRDKDDEPVRVKVDEADLADIAANTNRRYRQDGALTKLVIGHRKQGEGDERIDERGQPPVVGYGRNYSCRMVNRPAGPQLRLTYDEYYPPAHAAEARKYPSRSAEYNPAAKLITGVALLTRDPALPIGTTRQYAGTNTVLYAMGAVMADPMLDPPMPAAAGAVDPAMFDEICNMLRDRFPQLAGMMADAPPADAPGSDLPAAASSLPYQGTGGQTVNYAAQIATMQKQLAAERSARVSEQCRRMLDPLAEARQFDYDRELGLMVRYQADADRVAHAENIRLNYVPLPTGGPILPYPGDVRPRGAKQTPDKPPADHDAVMNYMYAEIRAGRSCDPNAARAALASRR